MRNCADLCISRHHTASILIVQLSVLPSRWLTRKKSGWRSFFACGPRSGQIMLAELLGVVARMIKAVDLSLTRTLSSSSSPAMRSLLFSSPVAQKTMNGDAITTIISNLWSPLLFLSGCPELSSTCDWYGVSC